MTNREIDAQIAQDIYGLFKISECEWVNGELCYPYPSAPVAEGCGWDYTRIDVSHFSTNMKDTWHLVEHLKDKCYRISLNYVDDFSKKTQGWHCLFQRDFREGELFDTWGCATAQEAICLSALKTTGCKEETK